MARVEIFVGGMVPLPDSGRPTGMYKYRVSDPIELGWEGFVGDHQADRRVHGGPEKAVHLYPRHHYQALAARFPEAGLQLVAGALGENLSTADLDERDVRIGDIWQLGQAQLQVCQPRNPCWKIDERFACDGMAAYIAETFLTGWYWRVIRPGWVPPEADLELLQPALSANTLRQAMELWQAHRPPLDELLQLAQTPGIASTWQDKIRQRWSYLKSEG